MSKSNLRPCKHCENLVARSAENCPKCGGKKPYPDEVAGPVTKAIVAILFASIMIGLPVADHFGDSGDGRANARVDRRADANARSRQKPSEAASPVRPSSNDRNSSSGNSTAGRRSDSTGHTSPQDSRDEEEKVALSQALARIRDELVLQY